MAMLNTLGMGMVLSYSDRASRGMKTASKNYEHLYKQSKKMSEALEKEIKHHEKLMNKYSKGAKVSAGFAVGGVLLAVPLIAAGKRAAQFEDNMTKVKSVIRGTGLELAEVNRQADILRKATLSWLPQTRTLPQDIEEANYALTSGFSGDAEKASAALPFVDMMNVATQGNMKIATDVMLKAFSGFEGQWPGLDDVEKADKIFNQIATTVAMFNTDLLKLGPAFSYVIPRAKMLGVASQEAFGVVGMLQETLPASMSGTAFAAGLRGLIQLKAKMKDVPDQESKLLSDEDYFAKFEEQRKKGNVSARASIGPLAGLKLMDEKGQLLPVYNIVKQMEVMFGITAENAKEIHEAMTGDDAISGAEAFERFGLTVQQAGYYQAAFGDEGQTMWATLLGRGDELEKVAKQIESGVGGQSMFDEMMSSTIAKTKQLSNQLGVQKIKLGSEYLPAVNSVTDGLREYVSTFDEFLDAHPTAAKWTAWGVAGVSALLTVGGSISTAVFGLLMLNAQMKIATALGAPSMFAPLSTALKAIGASALFASIKMQLFAFSAGIATAATTIFNAVLYANPIVWIIAAIIALGAAIVLLVVYWDEVKFAFKTAVAYIRIMWSNLMLWMDETPIFRELKWIIEKAIELGSGQEDNGEPVINTVKSARLQAGSYLPPDVTPGAAKGASEIIAEAKADEINPALPPGGIPQIITTNHFNIKTEGVVDEKKLSIEIEKRRQENKLRLVEGVN